MMGVMQGSAVMDRELLDAEAVCGHLLAEGSVHALLARHRTRCFLMRCSGICSRLAGPPVGAGGGGGVGDGAAGVGGPLG